MEKRLTLIDKLFYRSVECIHDRYALLRWRRDEEMLQSSGSNCSVDIPYTINGHKHISIGNDFRMCRGGRIQAWDNYKGYEYSPSLVIGDHVTINMNVDISCINRISIGNNVQMASNILVVDHFHGKIDRESMGIAPAKRELFSKGPVIIEDDVWIGTNAIILGGAHIGKGCIIGAGAIVSKRIPDYCVVINANQILYDLSGDR